jgi:hypothetical protein
MRNGIKSRKIAGSSRYFNPRRNWDNRIYEQHHRFHGVPENQSVIQLFMTLDPDLKAALKKSLESFRRARP